MGRFLKEEEKWNFLNGFSSCEIERLGAISTTFFPMFSLESSGLVLKDQILGKNTKHVFF